MQAGHERASRRCTYRAASIAIGETHPFGGHPVQVGRGEFLLAVTAQVAVAEVVGEDEDDVGWPLLFLRGEWRVIIFGIAYARGQDVICPGTGKIGFLDQAFRKASRNAGPRSCGRTMSTTANLGKRFKALAADSPKPLSRVSKQRKLASEAACTNGLFFNVFQLFAWHVCASIPNSFNNNVIA